MRIDGSKRVRQCLFAFGMGTVVAQAQTAPPPNQVPLPQGPPPTRPQGPVPSPKGIPPTAGHPILRSPDKQEVEQLVSGRTLTIDDAVAIALVTSRPLASALENLRHAQGRTGEAKAGLSPQAHATASATELNAPFSTTFGPTTITIQNQFSAIYAATVSLPLDISGSLRAAVSQAQFAEVAAKIDVNRARNQTVYDVRNAFYQVLRNQGALVVARDSLTNAQQRLADAEKSLLVGLASRFDVITIQRDVADSQQSVVNAKAQVTIALAMLKNTIGIDISVPIQVSDAGAVEEPPGVVPVTIPPPDPNGSATALPPSLIPMSQGAAQPEDAVPSVHFTGEALELGPAYDAVVKEALANRPEILESNAQIAAAERGILYARRSALPGLNVAASYVYQPNATPLSPSHQGSLQLNLDVPLFDGGLARARVVEAQADVASAQINRRTSVDQVTLEVQQAYVTIAQARDRVQVANVGLAQAEEAFRLAKVRYGAGLTQQPTVSPQLELSNAQTSLTQAQTNRLNALYDYNLARSMLDRAAGRYSGMRKP